MAKKNRNTKTSRKQPDLHEELQGFNIRINEFGEIVTSRPIDQLNNFLDRNVYDKKLNQTTSEEE